MSVIVHWTGMSVDQVAKEIGIPLEEWPGNCHAIAVAFNDAFKVGHTRYGHYSGECNEGSMFYQTVKSLGFCRHGWVECDDGTVIDPTRWAFLNVDPYVAHVHDPFEYDPGGNNMREGKEPPLHGTVGDVNVDFGEATTHVLELLGYSCPGQYHKDQMFFLANSSLRMLGTHAKKVFEVLSDNHMKGLIPIDNYRLAMGLDSQGNPL